MSVRAMRTSLLSRAGNLRILVLCLCSDVHTIRSPAFRIGNNTLPPEESISLKYRLCTNERLLDCWKLHFLVGPFSVTFISKSVSGDLVGFHRSYHSAHRSSLLTRPGAGFGFFS